MNEKPSDSRSLYDYSDKSIPQAGYAAMAYAIVSLLSGLLAWIQYFLYHRPGKTGWLDHGYSSQQWLAHTPAITVIAVGSSVLIAAISGALAYGIFRRNRAAIVAMIVFVLALQLYTWFVVRSIGGTLLTVVVVAFLCRGARRMFQDHAEANSGNA